MTALPVDAVIKTCTCCGRALDVEGWLALRLRGFCGFFRASTGERRALELRNCECGTTLAVNVVLA